MDAQSHPQYGRQVLLTLACAVIVLAGLRMAQDVLIPCMFATFLAIISYPVTQLLRDKCRFPHFLAVIFTIIVDFAILVGLGMLLKYLSQDIVPTIQHKYTPMILIKVDQFMDFCIRQGWEGYLMDPLKTLQNEIINPQKIMEWSTMLMSKTASMFVFTTLVLILMTFFLGEAPRFGRNIMHISEKSGTGGLHFLRGLTVIQKYLVIKTLISAITGLGAWAICVYIGLDFPFFWALIAFTLNFIPTFGSIVAAIPPIILAFAFHGVTDGFIVTFTYLFINVALGNIIEPTLLGRQFGIATSVILLSVVFWGWMWGPVGMFLAVPLTMMLKLAFERSDDLNWIAKLIDTPPDKKAPSSVLSTLQSKLNETLVKDILPTTPDDDEEGQATQGKNAQPPSSQQP